MCGIFGYYRITEKNTPHMLYEAFEKLRSRGPDRSTFHEISEFGKKIYLGFQRLAIMDPTTHGDQPFTIESTQNIKGDKSNHSIYAICNGEIYNFHELCKKYAYDKIVRGKSDCEFLPHFYADVGIEKMCDELRGEFAIAILDLNHTNKQITIHLARDGPSVRPLFFGMDKNGFGFASELKGLASVIDEKVINQIRGGKIFTSVIDIESDNISFHEKVFFDLKKYELPVNDTDVKYTYDVMDMMNSIYPGSDEGDHIIELHKILQKVRVTFERAVISTLESDVPLGALLSGGLDSSLVVSIAAKHLRKFGKKLRTFSIGIPGATDRAYAEMVAAEAGTIHTHVEFTIKDFIDAIPRVIKAIESYDITTVRASVGQYLISKWVHENTDIKVLLNGDYSDELFCSYLEVYGSKSAIAVHNNSIMRLSDILYFDALRSDRGIASNGIEARTPFGHRDMIECVIKIDPRLKVPLSDESLDGGIFSKRIEKWLLRKAFDIKYEDFDGAFRPYLPRKILARTKEGFSDGCSSKGKSWYEIIQESVENMYAQKDIDRWVKILDSADTKCSPWTKEAVHYLEIFTKYYGEAYQVIPYYWMPSFSKGVKDPSARVLEVYDK